MEHQEPSDVQNLIDRLEENSQESLAELFTYYQDRLRRMVSYRLDRRLQGRVSPSDVIQDAYLDARDRIPHFIEKRASMSFFVWLRLLVKQRLITLQRQHLGAKMRDVRQEVAFDYGAGSNATSISIAAHMATSLTSPSQALAHAELVSKLQEALQQMGPLDCEILALRHLEELSNDETSEVLGLKKAAASNRYVRALKRFRDVLSEIPGYDSGERK